MDFLILSALIGIILPWIFITYDITCQWSKNFCNCMAKFPKHMRINPNTKVDVAIPSWHINGHGERCRKDFCFGYMKGAGKTCGEEVEISWSHTNPLAPSVQEMGPWLSMTLWMRSLQSPTFSVRGCHWTTYISPAKCQAKLDIASFWRTWLCGWSFL